MAISNRIDPCILLDLLFSTVDYLPCTFDLFGLLSLLLYRLLSHEATYQATREAWRIQSCLLIANEYLMSGSPRRFWHKMTDKIIVFLLGLSLIFVGAKIIIYPAMYNPVYQRSFDFTGYNFFRCIHDNCWDSVAVDNTERKAEEVREIQIDVIVR